MADDNYEIREIRFVQIVINGNNLYGLDMSGKVWKRKDFDITITSKEDKLWKQLGMDGKFKKPIINNTTAPVKPKTLEEAKLAAENEGMIYAEDIEETVIDVGLNTTPFETL